MQKIFIIGLLTIFLIVSVVSHAMYIKHDGGLVSTDTTVLDDWQSSKNLGLFLVEDILEGPEYETQFSSDVYDLSNRETHWQYITLYKAGQKYKLRLKLLKLKIIDLWKGQKPQTAYVYAMRYPVTYHLKVGDRAIIPIYRWTDISGRSEFNVMQYNIKNFEDKIGKSFIYARVDNMLPVFRVIEDDKKELVVSGCVDGLTKQPLHDPLLTKLKDLLIPAIGKEIQTKYVGMFPAEISTRDVEKCRKVSLSEKALDVGLEMIRNVIESFESSENKEEKKSSK